MIHINMKYSHTKQRKTICLYYQTDSKPGIQRIYSICLFKYYAVRCGDLTVICRYYQKPGIRRLTETMARAYRTRGQHSVSVDGSGLASGMYFVNLTARDISANQKILLIR